MRHAPTSTFPDDAWLAPSRVAAPASPFRAVVARIRWLVGWPGRVAAVRRDLALLGGMSASELADVGLVRQDLWDAAALPLGRSPAPLLNLRAAERRRAELNRRR